MTAPAPARPGLPRAPGIEPRLNRLALLPLIGLALAGSAPAVAQVSGRVSLDSQYRARGYAVVWGDPVATATIGVDHPSGVYANGLILVGMRDGEPGIAGFQAGGGYARRVSPTVSLDIGLVHTEYARVIGGPLALRYTEGYVGVTRRNLTARAYYSPGYFARGRRTLYGEVEGNWGSTRSVAFAIHLGAFTYLARPPLATARTILDWRATVSRGVGPIDVYLSVSGRGPGGDTYAATRGRAVAAIGAALTF